MNCGCTAAVRDAAVHGECVGWVRFSGCSVFVTPGAAILKAVFTFLGCLVGTVTPHVIADSAKLRLSLPAAGVKHGLDCGCSRVAADHLHTACHTAA
jgi:hypothetical protein